MSSNICHNGAVNITDMSRDICHNGAVNITDMSSDICHNGAVNSGITDMSSDVTVQWQRSLLGGQFLLLLTFAIYVTYPCWVAITVVYDNTGIPRILNDTDNSS